MNAIHIRVEIHTSSYRAVRGYTVVAAVCDELAFWPTDDSASPDKEVVAALEPAMATIPNALLLGVSSPYAKCGVLWEEYRQSFGAEGTETLIWKSASRDMNPTLSRATVAAAYVKDYASASAEYGAEFRDDVSSFLSPEIVDAATNFDRRELPYLGGCHYFAFVDPSGGRSDSMTLAIAHEEKGAVILDCVREIPAPFSPEAAVDEFAAALKSYGLSEVTGDRYAGEWPPQAFAARGIAYKPSEQTKSELYLELLPLLSSGVARLLDNPRLRAQLLGLSRRTARGGRDSVDHAPGSHDDLANAVAGALVAAKAKVCVLGWIDYLKGGAHEQIDHWGYGRKVN